jgi:hypothetical protein
MGSALLHAGEKHQNAGTDSCTRNHSNRENRRAGELEDRKHRASRIQGRVEKTGRWEASNLTSAHWLGKEKTNRASNNASRD